MSVYDIQEEKMILSHFKPKVPDPQSTADFVKTRLEVMAKDIHPMDQIELHKKTGEMVYATLVDRATMAHELKESLKNTNTQLDFERMSSTAKDNRIKTLEDLIVDLGHDPKDPKAVRTLMKKKDDDINALRKRLKLPPTEHPQTAELQKEKEYEDLIDLMMQLNQKVIDLEKELEGALQDKQGESTSQAPPTTSTTATTTEAAVAPVTTTATTEAAATTTAPESSLNMEDLTKAIKELELQATEIKQAKEKLAELEAKYDKSKMTVAEQSREIKALKDKIKALEKELKLENALAEIKRILWSRIDLSLTRQWKSIKIVHEQMELIGQAHFETQKARTALGNRPEQANRMINFLNNQTKEELAAVNIINRTDVVLTAKKVLTLRNFVQTVERKCHEMQAEVDEYKLKMGALQQRGLPSLLTSSGRLLTREQYATRMTTFIENQITASSTISEEAGPPTG